MTEIKNTEIKTAVETAKSPAFWLKQGAEAIKSVMVICTALAIVAQPAYDNLMAEVSTIANKSAVSVMQLMKVEDAKFLLEKAHGKFKSGDMQDIRATNLQKGLTYSDEVIKEYPEMEAIVIWAKTYYSKTFIEVSA
ncbi:MAG: hypothetical protein ACN2B6_00230 [Rickettsiales bacterium]